MWNVRLTLEWGLPRAKEGGGRKQRAELSAGTIRKNPASRETIINNIVQNISTQGEGSVNSPTRKDEHVR